MKAGFFLVLFLMLFSLPELSQAGDYQITPLVGYTVGGRFDSTVNDETYDVSENANYGVILGLRDRSRADEAFFEFLYSRQESDFESADAALSGDSRFNVDINYFHLGGRYGKSGGQFNPFVAGGIGATLFSPEQGDAETRFSFSLGGGIMVPLSEHVELRFEGRGFGTLFNSRGELFCVDGRCAARIDSDLFWQFSGFAGITLSF